MGDQDQDQIKSERRQRNERVDYRKLNRVGIEDVKFSLGTGTSQEVPEVTPAKGGHSDDEKLGQAAGGDMDTIFSDLQTDGSEEESGEERKDGRCDSDAVKRLREELKQAKREERELLDQQEVERLRRQLAAKKESVRRLKGERDLIDTKADILKSGSGKRAPKKSAKTKGSVTSKDGGVSQVTIDDLRNNRELKLKVKAKMLEEGLDIFVESEELDSDSECENKRTKKKSKSKKKPNATGTGVIRDSSVESEAESRRKLKSKKKHIRTRTICESSDESDSDYEKTKKTKSGILSHSADRVVNQQKYPQAFLRFEHVSAKTSFEKLNINLFVAGELEIISSSGIDKAERVARIELLKRLMYLSSSYDFAVIRDLYAAVLRDIELGILQWGDDFQYVEGSILRANRTRQTFNYGEKNAFVGDRFGKPRKDEFETEEKTWFCSLYQRNKCAHKSAHAVVIKGKMRLAQHICASCYLKDKKKLGHPESSSACPYAGAHGQAYD